MKLLLVDCLHQRSVPSIKSWFQCADTILPELFDEVEIWAVRSDLADRPWTRFVPFPAVSRRWPIQGAAFRQMAWSKLRRRSQSAFCDTVVQTTGEMLPWTDIRYMQFWNRGFARCWKRHGADSAPSALHRSTSRLAAAYEAANLKPGATGRWWCVSRGIAEAILADYPAESEVRLIPNSYDSDRFHPALRQKFRQTYRDHYGFRNEEVVFVFCANGHFRRKGLRLAVEAIERLRSHHPVRLLVLGGSSQARTAFRRDVSRRGTSLESVVFAGQVDRVERHIAAADAFLFPSYFEAFSLAEIEAAALGLRLYLTAHPGSEMILREGVNGRLLPWDAPGIAAVLDEELSSGAVKTTHREMGEALDREAFTKRLRELYLDAIDYVREGRHLSGIAGTVA